ncbi:Phosphatidylinositol transfer protein alpha isoform [Toxocara canis]|uniref:Phosphatidylinositol transfer protein alpha isoform n=1 Tax=Toxocara canis TaxID=6265 RepID=A0A0B2UVQ0_TOXCA|nr:Phosphatidylinositol transfer protein alpha isoform [Toxocara canis]
MEYRVLIPLALDEYRKGQLFSVAEASKNETGGGEGVEVVKQEEFKSSMIKPGETISGIYTLKFYRIKSKSPWIVRRMLPDGAFVLREDCWNAYPYCKTVVTNPDYMRDNFYIVIESMHIEDNGTTENALNLSANLLKHREVITLDIYDEQYLKKGDTTPQTNPRLFHSKITGRGPLQKNWVKTTKPVMCCYKVVQVLFKWKGLQTTIERIAHKQYPRLFTKFHRETFCWIDRWYDLTMDDIKRLEERTAQQLKNQIVDPQKRGIRADDDDRPSRLLSLRRSLRASAGRCRFLILFYSK